MGKKTENGQALRNRIVGEGMEAPADLLANPANWRRHPREQLAALEGMLEAVGWVQRVIVNRTTGRMVDGHARFELAIKRAEPAVPVLFVELTEAEERVVLAGLDPIGGLAATDQAQLDALLEGVESGSDALDEFLASLRSEGDGEAGRGDPDATPPPDPDEVTRTGDVWILGRQRVMCGDSTNADDVRLLMAGSIASLLHADPPYGMGKQADGVANDNLYRDKLDAFQMAWWRAFRPHLAPNSSAYVWGNSPDLWRLWHAGGLGSSERFELRNEIVWDKKSIAGMASPDLTQYPEASERCLFFQFGQQFLANVNTEDFPSAWEPLRAYMEGEASQANMGAGDLKRLCGVGMFSHWFTRAQFTLIPEKHYAALAAAYPGRFGRAWSDLKAEWDRVKGRARDVIGGKLSETRSYFDNAHDVMRDVWEFPRVLGDDRHGHATPKPVAMMERVMRSSLPEGGLCAEPFGGSGSTVIGAEKSGRRCFCMELQPIYCDVIVRRWQTFTGQAATLEGDGRTFAEIEADRLAAEVAP